uniref:Phosphoinositide-3-kinase interacting protein 1 n=1 Tax=Catharus ustulatus TaxID=91951 RepID=A0A8C3UMH6_CATUS
LRGSGASYRGSRQVASGGAPCLNWLTVRSGPGAGLPAGGSGCRNPDGDAAPWCYIQGATGIPERRSCDIAQCSGKSGPAGLPLFCPPWPAPYRGDEQVFEPADTLPSRSEAAAVQPVIGISQRVQMNSKEKKDLGTLEGRINK